MAARAPSPVRGEDLASSASNIERRSAEPHPYRRFNMRGVNIKRNVHLFQQQVASRITGTKHHHQQQLGSSSGVNHSDHDLKAGLMKPSGHAGTKSSLSSGQVQQAAIEENRRSLEEQFQRDAELARAAKESSGLAPFLTRADISVHAYMALLSDLSNLVSG